jgi:cobalt-zinc-cadmium efflux system membrane fusion protein
MNHVFALALVLGLPLLVNSGCGGGPAPEETVGEQHEEHGEERVIRLDSSTLEELGLELAEASPGVLEVSLELPGEVRVNGDRMAHVAPRVGGVARKVHASLGDTVRAGQLLAILESRDLADAKAAYLAAGERKQLAEATFRREERLWRDRVSSEQDYLDAKNGLAEVEIELRAAEQKLHAVGFGEEELSRLSAQPDTEYTSYRLTAPFDGEVIDRHITVGETIAAEQAVFTIADLSTVWIDLSVYQKNLADVEAGQSVRFAAANDGLEGEGTIEFVQPLLGEDTRTALARIVVANPGRHWKPGLFVTAQVVTDAVEVSVRVPRTALIRMEDGDDVIFAETDEGFEPRQVSLGRLSRDFAEVLSGLAPGERYVARGGFGLKAELGKDAFGGGHGY